MNSFRWAPLLLVAGCATVETPVTAVTTDRGSQSRISRPFALLVSTEENWKTLLERMFDKPAGNAIDFRHYRVLVVSDGDSFNCEGLDAGDASENAECLLVRVRHLYYQTAGGEDRVRPYGFILLPRREGKPVVVEVNAQTLIGNPPIWKERCRLLPSADPARELETLPK